MKLPLIAAAVAALLLASVASTVAQEATNNTPVTRTSEAKQKIRAFVVNNPPGATPPDAKIDVSVQDSSNVEIRMVSYGIPDAAHPTASVPGLVTAMMTVRATETGTDTRKMQFRILGYLSDQGYITGVTLVP